MIYYPWGSGYAALKGDIFWCKAGNTTGSVKPLVTARYSLWGDSNDTDQLMVGVDAMIAKLKKMPLMPATSPEAYSLIVAHAWSHNYTDVARVAQALQQTGNFDIVLPSELLRRVRRHYCCSILFCHDVKSIVMTT